MFAMHVEGGEEAAAALNSLPSRVSRRVQVEALMAGGEPMRRRIAQLAPRHPGAPDLADNIFIAPLRKRPGDDSGDVSVGIGTAKFFFYDFFLEYGTVHMEPRPFYRPSFDEFAPDVIASVSADLWTSLAGRGFGRSVTSSTQVQSEGRFL